MSLVDSKDYYGTITRLFHWGLALLIFWELLSAGSHLLLEDTAIEAFMWPTHKPVGFVIFVLAIMRFLWALANMTKRPPSTNIFAKLGHLALYALMIGVPMLALLRQYGSGRAFELFGMTIMPARENDKIMSMIDLGNNWHSILGWVLLAAIVGHIVMTIWHRVSASGEDVLPRMWK